MGPGQSGISQTNGRLEACLQTGRARRCSRRQAEDRGRTVDEPSSSVVTEGETVELMVVRDACCDDSSSVVWLLCWAGVDDRLTIDVTNDVLCCCCCDVDDGCGCCDVVESSFAADDDSAAADDGWTTDVTVTVDWSCCSLVAEGEGAGVVTGASEVTGAEADASAEVGGGEEGRKSEEGGTGRTAEEGRRGQNEAVRATEQGRESKTRQGAVSPLPPGDEPSTAGPPRSPPARRPVPGMVVGGGASEA